MRAPALVLSLLLVAGAYVALVPAPARAATADWTFLIYMDGDNNLESVGIDNFLQMAAVGSTPQVNIVVQFDRAPAPFGTDTRYGDWTDTKRFYVTRGMVPTPQNALMNLSELDMADPANLINFVDWGATAYPADHYFLDIWDHGLGWQGVLTDDTSGTFMATPQLAVALEQITIALHRKIDIVGNDACRMTLEIMDQLRPYADYFVGSQKDEPLAGWPYDTFLNAVVADPAMTPVQVGSWLTAAYVASYRDPQPPSPYSVTLALVSGAALPGLVATFRDFVTELNASEPLLQARIMAARLATERYEKNSVAGGDEFDLYNFAENVIAMVGNPRLSARAADLEAAISNAVLANAVWDNPDPINGVHALHAHGLSIWFPDTVTEPGYVALNLSRESGWGGFLLTYRQGVPAPLPTGANATTQDTNSDGLTDRIVVHATPPENGTLVVALAAGPTAVSSVELLAVAGQTETLPFAPALPAFYNVTVLYYVGGKLADDASFANLAIQARYTFSGTVTDEHGAPIAGAAVTLTNARTHAVLSATTTAAGFSVEAVIPEFFQDGDLLVLNATYGGRQASASFVASARGTSQTADLVLDLSGPVDVNGATIALAVAALAVAVLLAVIVAWQQRQIRGLRRRPGP